MMQWEHLFSTQRIGQAAFPEHSVRSEYQRDGDRLIFSASFRRMKDKTQVFPLEKNDYVRTRLTHSLEVSCVGRSLGSSIGKELLTRYPHLKEHIDISDVGDIVSAACLAHDIGNPPFGHAGEQAMRDYFNSEEGQQLFAQLKDKISPQEKADLLNIEGNAQGFRICNRLENPDNYGGIRLTITTLASAIKYPCLAFNKEGYYKKNGVYQDDLEEYRTVFKSLNIPEIQKNIWLRHPLSYLMESADDICYLIVDLEDAYQIGLSDFQIIYNLFHQLAGNLIDHERLKEMKSKSDQLAYLRAKAIGQLVYEVTLVFWQYESQLLSGKFSGALLDHIPSKDKLELLRKYAIDKVYRSRPVLETQIAGHQVLNGLMSYFCPAVTVQAREMEISRYQKMLLDILPDRYQRYAKTPYQKLLGVCDYICGMTDSYAVSLYKKLTGISLPN